MKPSTLLLAALGVCVFAVACSGAPTDIKWTEEVKLQDGSVIVVKRRMELTGGAFPTSRRGLPRYHELCYAEKGIYWKSKPEYEPELLDVVDGKVYVRVPLGSCSSCMLHDYPENNAIQFVWNGKAWTKIQQSELPKQLRFNLLSSIYGDDDGSYDARGLITLAEKRKRDGNILYQLEHTNATSLRETPDLRDYCRKCKEHRITTDETPDVFLESRNKTCSW